MGVRDYTDGSVEIPVMAFFLYLGVIAAQEFFQFGIRKFYRLEIGGHFKIVIGYFKLMKGRLYETFLLS
jgi:hypothetical protein